MGWKRGFIFLLEVEGMGKVDQGEDGMEEGEVGLVGLTREGTIIEVVVVVAFEEHDINLITTTIPIPMLLPLQLQQTTRHKHLHRTLRSFGLVKKRWKR